LPVATDAKGRKPAHQRFGRQATLFVVLALASNMLAFLYQLAMARLLEPRQFAAVLAIISAMAVIAIPANAFQTAVATGAGRLSAEGRSSHLGAFALRAGIGGGAPLVPVAVLALVFRDAVGQFFGVDGASVVLWICVSLVLTMWLAAHRGTLQGSEEFTVLGVVMLAEAALRLLTSVALVLGGFGVDGATAGIPLGICGALAYGVWALRHRFDRDSQNFVHGWLTLARESRAVPALLSVFGAQAIDIVIANTRLQDADLESFSAAALAGRVVFYAGFLVSLIALPRYRHMFSVRRLDDRLVAGSFAAIALICTGGVVAGFVLPRTIHTVLVGSTYTTDSTLMQVYLIGSSALTCALFLTTVVVAAGWSRVSIGLVPIAFIQVIVYALLATTGMAFAQTLTAAAGGMVLMLIGIVVALFRTTAWSKSRQPRRLNSPEVPTNDSR
jgi:O-antigen/teichoic acid export membrane protein